LLYDLINLIKIVPKNASINSHLKNPPTNPDNHKKQKCKKNLLTNYNYYMCKKILNQQIRGGHVPFDGAS